MWPDKDGDISEGYFVVSFLDECMAEVIIAFPWMFIMAFFQVFFWRTFFMFHFHQVLCLQISAKSYSRSIDDYFPFDCNTRF